MSSLPRLLEALQRRVLALAAGLSEAAPNCPRYQGPLHYHDSSTVSWLTRFGRMRAWHPATAVPPADKSTAPCWSCWEWKRDGSAARWPRLVALLGVVVPMSWRHDWRGCLSVSKSVRWLSGGRASLDRIDWSGGQAINLHFRPQGPASYLDDRRSKQHRHFRWQLRLAVPLRRLLAEGDRFPPIVPQLRHNDSELLFEQFRHQPPMAPHVERLPTQQNGIGPRSSATCLASRESSCSRYSRSNSSGSFAFRSQRGGARRR